MKVQYISSACVVVEHEGVRVLCDPWLTEGIYYGSWYHYPLPAATLEDFSDVDYIYISHIHPDHCDLATLKRLPKQIPILIHNYEEKFLLRSLSGLGFQQVIEVAHKQPYVLGPNFTVEILAADNCDPTKCGLWFGCQMGGKPERTTQIDSLALFRGGDSTVVNTNDCPFALAKEVCDYLVHKYSKIDFLLVGYSGAGPYPQCFPAMSSEEKLEKGRKKREQFIAQAMAYIKALKPRHFLPFAGQYTLGGSLSGLNPFRGVPELEELPQIFADLPLVLLNSGEVFDVDRSQASAPFSPPDAGERVKYIEEVLKQKKFAYEGMVLSGKVEKRLQDAYQRMVLKQKKYGFSSKTVLYLDVEGSLFKVSFDGSGVERAHDMQEPFVCIALHPGLLEMILNRQAHWNNAEIGSHLSFYRSPDVYERGIYHFLSYFHC